MLERERPLAGLRVLAALNGLELFGQERDNIEVYKTLRALGSSVSVGVNGLDCGGDVGRHLRELGFPTFPLPFGNQWSLQWLRHDPMSVFAKAWSVAACSASFRKKISELRPTHILLGNPLAYSYLSIALAFSKAKVIYRMEDCPPFDSPFNLRIWRLAMRRASHVAACSDFVRRAAISGGVPAYRLSVIFNLAPSMPASSAARAVEPAVSGKKVRSIVYVGAVSEHKGVRQLVQAFAILRRRFPDLVLDVVGGSRFDTPFRGEMSRLVEKTGLRSWVVMHGHQRDPTQFYRSAAIHVAPSVWEEPLGNIVLEAKREGVPSVVFRSGGLPELVRHGVDGVICEEKTPEALAAGIATLLGDEEHRRKAGCAAREDFERRFGPDRFSQQWRGVFLQSSTSEPRNRPGQDGGRP